MTIRRRYSASQKAPSAKRCIKTLAALFALTSSVSQKAPSAKRCIKTSNFPTMELFTADVRKHRAPKGALRHRLDDAGGNHRCRVKKHRAPKGALRPTTPKTRSQPSCVRKHRAPKGALRLEITLEITCQTPGQKAPSAKRCIKTPLCGWLGCVLCLQVRKHRAPKGALRCDTWDCLRLLR